MTVTVIRPGTAVMIGPDAGIRGRVETVTLDLGMNPRYLVSWWSERNQLTATFDTTELPPVTAHTATIGFSNERSPA